MKRFLVTFEKNGKLETTLVRAYDALSAAHKVETARYPATIQSVRPSAKKNPSPPRMTPSAKLKPKQTNHQLALSIREKLKVKKRNPAKKKRVERWLVQGAETKKGQVIHWYYTGAKLDTIKKNARTYSSSNAAFNAAQEIVRMLPPRIKSLRVVKA